MRQLHLYGSRNQIYEIHTDLPLHYILELYFSSLVSVPAPLFSLTFMHILTQSYFSYCVRVCHCAVSAAQGTLPSGNK